ETMVATPPMKDPERYNLEQVVQKVKQMQPGKTRPGGDKKSAMARLGRRLRPPALTHERRRNGETLCLSATWGATSMRSIPPLARNCGVRTSAVQSAA